MVTMLNSQENTTPIKTTTGEKHLKSTHGWMDQPMVGWWLIMVDLYIFWSFAILGILELSKEYKIITRWWLNHPFEKHARQIGILPQVGVKPPPRLLRRYAEK